MFCEKFTKGKKFAIPHTHFQKKKKKQFSLLKTVTLNAVDVRGSIMKPIRNEYLITLANKYDNAMNQRISCETFV